MALTIIEVPATCRAQYRDYPQTVGRTQKLSAPFVPSWLSLDMYLRERTERQTAFSYVSGSDHSYDLTRVLGGAEVKPASWLSGYLQFMDSHAPGLPLTYTAANMKDSFDFRQGYIKLHREGVSIVAGRQELKFGGERLIGISDWTNVSRTFDGFSGRFGGKNRIDLFTASVVKIYPASLDNHVAGLNFHGAYGTLSTLLLTQ